MMLVFTFMLMFDGMMFDDLFLVVRVREEKTSPFVGPPLLTF